MRWAWEDAQRPSSHLFAHFLELEVVMKGILQFVVSVVLHPVAMVLAWINIAGRSDLGAVQKVVWGVVSIIWGIGPILYIVVGGGDLW